MIILSSQIKHQLRQRYIEVYKLRNTAHCLGQHKMAIAQSGITVTPNSEVEHSVK